MPWSTLRAIVESRAYWSLNLLFLVVPMLSRVGLPVHWELLASYLAAWLLLIAGLLFYIARPAINKFHDFAQFEGSGQTADQLSDWYRDSGGNVTSDDGSHVATRLRNENRNTTPDKEVFWFVHKHIDESRRPLRWLLVTFMLLAALFILSVNVSRLYDVFIDFAGPKEARMARTLPPAPVGTQLKVGGPVEVTHDDGTSTPTTTSGTLVDVDDNGYLVIKVGNDLVSIPKPRVIWIKQSSAP